MPVIIDDGHDSMISVHDMLLVSAEVGVESSTPHEKRVRKRGKQEKG